MKRKYLFYIVLISLYLLSLLLARVVGFIGVLTMLVVLPMLLVPLILAFAVIYELTNNFLHGKSKILKTGLTFLIYMFIGFIVPLLSGAQGISIDNMSYILFWPSLILGQIFSPLLPHISY